MAARGFARMLAGHLEADISVRFYYFGQQPILVVVPAEKKKERKKEKGTCHQQHFFFRAHHIPNYRFTVALAVYMRR
jgi:hypothetical protein